VNVLFDIMKRIVPAVKLGVTESGLSEYFHHPNSTSRQYSLHGTQMT
jgi:hypothetical protein